jgi:DNA-directed RNA polymerase subunit beta
MRTNTSPSPRRQRRSNERGQFRNPRPSARRAEVPLHPDQRIDFMDVAPKQIVGVSAALDSLPGARRRQPRAHGFEHAAPGRAAGPPDAPVVGTGMEYQAALDSGQVVLAKHDGRSRQRVGREDRRARGETARARVYNLRKYNRSNQSTCIDQRPVVFKGDGWSRRRRIGRQLQHRATANWPWARTWWSPT